MKLFYQKVRVAKWVIPLIIRFLFYSSCLILITSRHKLVSYFFFGLVQQIRKLISKVVFTKTIAHLHVNRNYEKTQRKRIPYSPFSRQTSQHRVILFINSNILSDTKSKWLLKVAGIDLDITWNSHKKRNFPKIHFLHIWVSISRSSLCRHEFGGRK